MGPYDSDRLSTPGHRSLSTPTHRESAQTEPAPRPSKTQLKKAMHDLQALGEALLELNDAQLDSIAMPGTLRDALRELRRVRTHEGRRRQLQYVGKLMRSADPAPLQEAVAAQRLGHARDTLALHEAEAWRERLLAGDDALDAWMQLHPHTDSQHLRALVRAARREAAQPDHESASAGAHRATAPRKGRAYRELFQWLREALAAPRTGNEAEHE
jgi:ribosome-associated protein